MLVVTYVNLSEVQVPEMKYLYYLKLHLNFTVVSLIVGVVAILPGRNCCCSCSVVGVVSGFVNFCIICKICINIDKVFLFQYE